MDRSGRRDFLRLGAGAATLGLLPPSIRRAVALPAAPRSGTIEDVEHIVVFMQENRSFDHYFGHLSGVRGYNDRFPVLRADGRPVWYQPRHGDPTADVLPFRLPTQTSSAQCVLDLDHNWHPTHAAIAAGRNDRWPPNKTDMTMGYYTRADIPFHYALADAFTICDHYFCSTPTQTHPNRMYLMTGMLDPTGQGGGPLLDNIDYVDRAFYKQSPPPFTWTTYPERLEAAGISWQVYQQGLSVTDSFNGNFGTNALMNFRQFIDAPADSPLHRRGMSRRTLDDLTQDVLKGKLPQVSWLLPPAAYSEHPRWAPGYGATYVARVLDALTADPAVWAKTVLLIMYDENDGYFDHLVPPQPPTPVLPGQSTVSTEGEIHDRASSFAADKYPADQLPFGLGPRVGMLAISPWSNGGYVCSQVFDHSSVIRFIEARFGVAEPNITPWRRAVCGDLTAAFDFTVPHPGRSALPDTHDYLRDVDLSCHLPKPAVPAHGDAADIGAQEPGVRPARPLPYDLAVDEIAGPGGGEGGTLTLRLASNGKAAACFYAYREHTDETPRRYTVGAGAALTDHWPLPGDAPHVFTLTGPNGFVRRYHRQGGAAPLRVAARHDAAAGAVVLTLTNPGPAPVTATVTDLAYGAPLRSATLLPGATLEQPWPLARSGFWYDLSVTIAGRPDETTRLAGHVETGAPSITDPAATAPSLSM